MRRAPSWKTAVFTRYGVPLELQPLVEAAIRQSDYSFGTLLWTLQTLDREALRMDLETEVTRHIANSLSYCSRCETEGRSGDLHQLDAPGVQGSLCSPCFEYETNRLKQRLRGRFTDKGQPVADDNWNNTCAFFGNRCAYCGGNWFVVEHIVPRSCGGGDDANCVPACFRCNNIKSNKPLEVVAGKFNGARIAKIKAWRKAVEEHLARIRRDGITEANRQLDRRFSQWKQQRKTP